MPSLLNSYLSARYGNGDYVDTYSGSHVYLDHKQIEAMKLDLNEVAEASRDFLCENERRERRLHNGRHNDFGASENGSPSSGN